MGGWLGPGTALDDAEMREILPLSRQELRPIGRETCSQSLLCARRSDRIG
jgi:hypothetical protein